MRRIFERMEQAAGLSRRWRSLASVLAVAVGIVAVASPRAEAGFLRNPDGSIVAIVGPGGENYKPAAINDFGVITGNTDVFHGFVRDSAGVFTTFASPGPYVINPYAINNAGTVVGNYAGDAFSYLGFTRDSSGTITPVAIDTPNIPSDYRQTYVLDLNNSGTAVGIYNDSAAPDPNLDHEFTATYIRDAAGNITKVSIPNATLVFSRAINDLGDIAGIYRTKLGTEGFVRSAAGIITSFSLPAGNTGVDVYGINSVGTVVGTYYGSASLPALNEHGFIRDAAGNFTTFDIPGSIFTSITGINEAGTIVGYFRPFGSGIDESFTRDAAGNVTIIGLNGVSLDAVAINNLGQVIGNSTAVPEPRSALMLAIGVVGMIGLDRRLRHGSRG